MNNRDNNVNRQSSGNAVTLNYKVFEDSRMQQEDILREGEKYMKTYVLECDGKIYTPNLKVNKRGFYKEEIEDILKDDQSKKYNIISIEEEVEKYNLCDLDGNRWGLSMEVFQYMLWNRAYFDNNIKGFLLPISVNTNDEYRKTLKKKLDEYNKCLNRPAFVYNKKMLEFIANECDLILKIIDDLIAGNGQNANIMIAEMLSLFKDDPFFISDLDHSYSFRGVAPFDELHSRGCDDDYVKMMEQELTFYRIRIKNSCDKENITDVEDMLHIPYNLREKATSMRFSVAGEPALYLGTTTYICGKECDWNGSDELYASVFVPNSIGKKYKILNLTISQALINGIYNRNRDCNSKIRCRLQSAMLKIFPLVIATSFSVKNDEDVKYQYLLSQALMREANKNGIDGIAYLSMKGESEFQYPQGVNLAIPAVDISENNVYSEKCKGFSVSEPVMYSGQAGKRKVSYINQIYNKYELDEIGSYTAKLKIDGKEEFYGDTDWGKFDDFLAEKIIIEHKDTQN